MVSLPGLLISIIDSCPSNYGLPLSCFTEYRDQLVALDIIRCALYSIAKAFTNLKVDLDEEKAA
jgi:hypothetical protein